jgi:glycerol uptake facilitator-like aquaporin
MTLGRKIAAEALGTGMLLAAVVGSGIMGERLSDGNIAIALLANTIATSAALIAIILALGGISGAHLNPAVTVSAAIQGDLRWREVPGYVVAQIVGALAGVAAAHYMFGLAMFTASHHGRAGLPQVFSEFVATLGLVSVICGCARSRQETVPFAVGAYIGAAYWFTASTSFANPAVTIARSLTDTFSGIQPIHVPGFIVAQTIGMLCATFLWSWLSPLAAKTARNVPTLKTEKELAHAK